MRPVKTQISLRIRAVWSESSLSAWRKLRYLSIQCALKKPLIRLHDCTGLSESSRGEHVRRYIPVSRWAQTYRKPFGNKSNNAETALFVRIYANIVKSAIHITKPQSTKHFHFSAVFTENAIPIHILVLELLRPNVLKLYVILNININCPNIQCVSEARVFERQTFLNPCPAE